MNKIGKKKVIAASFHRGSANAISPVITELINEGKVDVVVVGYGPAQEAFRSFNIDYKAVDCYELEDISTDSMIQLLKIEKPSLVLTGAACQTPERKDVLEQTITLAAKNLGIKSLAVLDFWVEYRERFSDFFTDERFKFLPDKIAVMDNIAVEEMLSKGFSKEKLIVTGNPYFSELEKKAASFPEKERKALREKISLNCKLLVFYATTSFEREKDKLGYWDLDNIRIINEVLLNLPREKVGLAIGVHSRIPEEDLRKINQYVGYSSQRIKVLDGVDGRELILVSDLVLVSESTIGVEAVLLGKPCLSLQPGLKKEDPLIVSKLGIIPAGYTEDDCKREIERAILDKDHRERIIPMRYTDFRTDSKATERVVDLVYKMLQ